MLLKKESDGLRTLRTFLWTVFAATSPNLFPDIVFPNHFLLATKEKSFAPHWDFLVNYKKNFDYIKSDIHKFGLLWGYFPNNNCTKNYPTGVKSGKFIADNT